MLQSAIEVFSLITIHFLYLVHDSIICVPDFLLEFVNEYLGSKHGQEVADQLIEISLRVDDVRPFAVESMLSMLLTDSLILGQARQTVSEVTFSYNILSPISLADMITMSFLDYRNINSIPKVLKAAAWIVGEYSEIVSLIAADTGRMRYHSRNCDMQFPDFRIHLLSGLSISMTNSCTHCSLTLPHSHPILCSL